MSDSVTSDRGLLYRRSPIRLSRNRDARQMAHPQDTVPVSTPMG